ncbi:MAG: D-alanyl-D-alanine carboxypeptidase family protein, partial [Lachnospiraceae bacterium]
MDENELYARSAVLMDAASGRVLFEKNGNEIMPMASTTKIMTLIVTLENANLEDTVQVSAYAASMPDVQLNMREGEEYRLYDLLYSLMLESHNDSAVAIAEHVAGSKEN